MEDNVADALKMAGSVLLFVLGLSIVFLAYSDARQAIDAVLSHSDRESYVIEEDARYYYLQKNAKTSRVVGKETIIPTIYRAYKENYKIVFEFKDPDYYLFMKNGEKINTIDLQKQSIGSDLESRQFLDGIIYGKFDYEPGKTKNDYIGKFSLSTVGKGDVNDKSKSLFYYIKDTDKITESLGTYYQEDTEESTDKRDERSARTYELTGTYSPTEVSEANKTEKRVITYTFE